MDCAPILFSRVDSAHTMTSTPPLAQLPRAHLLALAFPAATALAAQGVSRPASPSAQSRSPSFSRSPSPTLAGRTGSGESSAIELDAFPPTTTQSGGSSSRATSWGPSTRRSRSQDALCKEAFRDSSEMGNPLLRWLWITRPNEVELEEERGRQLGRLAVAQLDELPVCSRSGGKNWILSREKAQLVVSFCMIALVGMNDSATGANVSSFAGNERE